MPVLGKMPDALFRLRAFSDECHGMVVQNEAPWELAVLQGVRCVALVPLTLAEYERLQRAIAVPQRQHPLPYIRKALQQSR
jgi:hypothetical protein